MSAIDERLSAALVTYIGDGRLSAPSRDESAVRAKYPDVAPALIAHCDALIADADAIPVDWTSRDEDEMEQYIRETMRAQHPELSDAAVDALYWRFSYMWR